MNEKLKTPHQLKCEKTKGKIIELYEATATEQVSQWRKAIFIANKLGMTAGYVARVIKVHNEAKN